MYKILSNSYSALQAPQSYGRIAFNALILGSNNDQASEIAKRIKQEFFLRATNYADQTYLLSAKDSGWIFSDPKIEQSIADEKIYLDKDAVELIEKKWLNNYHFPEELLDTFASPGIGNPNTNSYRPHVIRLDKLLQHLQNITGSARDALNRFLETKMKN
jgi:hypothetical protein